MAESLKTRVRDGLIRLAAPVADRAYRESPRVRVISLHDIPVGARDDFRTKIRALARRHHFVPLASAYERISLDPERLNLVLTFDDAFREHHAFVPPVLAELNVPATFFVPTGALDLSADEAERFARDGLRRTGSFEFMTSGEVGELAREPRFEIGGHTASHPDLGGLADQARLDEEIIDDKAALERVTGKPLRWFAFPFGSGANISAEAVRTIARAGYRAAFTIMPGFWSKKRNPYLVGRDCLSVESGDDVWDGFLRGGYDALTWAKYHRRLKEIRVA